MVAALNQALDRLHDAVDALEEPAGDESDMTEAEFDATANQSVAVTVVGGWPPHAPPALRAPRRAKICPRLANRAPRACRASVAVRGRGGGRQGALRRGRGHVHLATGR